jgi:hypothetical protein
MDLKRVPIEERLLLQTEIQGECWICKASLDKDGYARLRIPHCDLRMRAHRLSYLLFVGEIPDGMCVCHRCDVRNCIRPDHLFLGTNGENSKDRHSKGRTCRGARHTNAKLSDSDVRSIRVSYPEMNQVQLAKKYDVSQCTIFNVLRNKHYIH